MRKKIFSLITIIGLATIITLTGCGKKEENNTNVEKEENKPTVSLINEDKNIVYTVKEDSGYKIPKINLTYDKVKELNKEILAYGEQKIADMTVEGKVETGGTLDYKYYENDNILSIVYEYESPFAAMPDKYKVWNIDKYTGETITNEQILAKKGFEADEFEEKFIQKCKEKYEEFGKEAKEAASQTEELAKFYDTQLEKTVSKENNNVNCSMYLGADNEIYMIAKIYSLAAADYYEQIITVEK